MLNKKAIAALAAGATLVSGLAFATPSFAAEPQAPKKEECKPADAKILRDAELKVNNAYINQYNLEAKLDKAQKDLEDANAARDAAQKIVDEYKNAVKAYKEANTKSEAETDPTKKAPLDAVTAQKKADVVAVIAKAKANKDLKDKAPATVDATISETAFDTVLTTQKTGLNAKANSAQLVVYVLEGKLTAAKAAVKAAQDELAKLQCKTTPAPAPQPGPQPGPQNPVTLPTVVADPTTKDEAINATRLAAMVLQNAENDLAKKNHDYNDVKAAYEKVIRELSVAKANLEKAQHDLDAFLASGVDDSAKETRLTDLRDRAQAHVTRLAAEFTALTLKYNDAKTAAVNAGAAFKAAKAQYKKIYNEAIALGVNPALLPVVATSDPLMPNFADPAGAKELYAEAVSGKFGDAVAAAAKKGQKEAGKKGEAKKGAAAPAGAKLDTKAAAAASAAPLSKTGATVMFTALAASMLAGIGAAVRKFRH